jgi:glyceraldehyde 3-phosphate dehydrogenase
MARVAINGLGRIGRAALKVLIDDDDMEVVAINDVADLDNLVYLLKYDSVYGRNPKQVRRDGNHLVVGERRIAALQEPDPAKLPWKDLGVDLVFECSGRFLLEEDLAGHVTAGAEFVIVSAPTKSDSIPTVVHGVNTPDEGAKLISCASCTTNCITPVMEVMGRRIGIERAIMTTIHAYTAGQRIVDAPSTDVRRGRAGAANLVPTSTGAARASGRALPDLVGRFDGVSVRAPIPVGSIADIVFVASRTTTAMEVNDIFREEALTDRYRGILGVSEDPLVSSDVVGDSHASIVDLGLTMVVDATLVKIMSWYDNEWGFTNQMVREARSVLAGT